MVGRAMLKNMKYKNVLNFVDLMYSVIELSLGEYENSVDMLIKLVEEQNQNDQLIIGKYCVCYE